MILSENFDSSEFQSVSDAPLTAAQLRKAAQFATELLQPLRTAMGFPVSITSFVRHGTDPHATGRPHENGDAVDFVPTSRNPTDYTRMRDWLGNNMRDQYGELLYELTPRHLHMTLLGFHGETGQTLNENSDRPDTFSQWVSQKVAQVQQTVTETARQIGATVALTTEQATEYVSENQSTVIIAVVVLSGLVLLWEKER